MTTVYAGVDGDRERLRAEVSARLRQATITGASDDADRDSTVETVITAVLRERNLAALRDQQPPMPAAVEEQLRQSLRDAFIGLGDLQRYIDDPDVEDIEVNGCDNVWVTWAGQPRRQVPPVAGSDDELIDMLQTLARRSGAQERRFDLGVPELDLRLSDGSRLFATMAVTERVSVTIRRHRFLTLTLADLARMGSITPAMVDMFTALMKARCNLIISGGMGTGKTTMARALCRVIPPSERIITIEDPYELGLDRDPEHPNVVAMQPRQPNIEGKGGIDMTALVRYATRMNPDHVVVGEVRGPEVIPLLNAFNQGTDGSLTTIHASGTRDAWMKIAAYARQAKEQLPFDVTFLLIGGGVDVVVQLAQSADGKHRYVSGIREVVDADATQVRSNEIFRAGRDGRAMLVGRFSDPMTERLDMIGYDVRSLGQRNPS